MPSDFRATVRFTCASTVVELDAGTFHLGHPAHLRPWRWWDEYGGSGTGTGFLAGRNQKSKISKVVLRLVFILFNTLVTVQKKQVLTGCVQCKLKQLSPRLLKRGTEMKGVNSRISGDSSMVGQTSIFTRF